MTVPIVWQLDTVGCFTYCALIGLDNRLTEHFVLPPTGKNHCFLIFVFSCLHD